MADTFESEIYRAGLRCFLAATEDSWLWQMAHLAVVRADGVFDLVVCSRAIELRAADIYLM